MQVFLGDNVTLIKKDTYVTGTVAGIVLNDGKLLDRMYIHGIPSPFRFDQGWFVAEDEEEEDEI